MKACIPFVTGVGDSVELRYVLRSHALYEPDWEPVLIVNDPADVPRWYGGEWRIGGTIGKPQNVHVDHFRKLIAFSTYFPDQTFVYSPDDCFLLGPWPDENRIMAKSPIYGSIHAEAMTNTAEALTAIGESLYFDYQLHCPEHRHTGRWLELCSRLPGRFGVEKPILPRTLYGNVYRLENTVATWDRKVINFHKYPEDRHKFVSTQDQMAMDPKFHAWLKSRFPKRSPWERL